MARTTLVFAVLCAASIAGATPADFNRDVAPILAANCAVCHSDKVKTSGFSVTSLDAVLAGGKKHGRAVVGGHPELSPLVQLLKGRLTPQMPVGAALGSADIVRIEDWIRSLPAAKADPKTAWRWPFEKPAKPAVPQVRNEGWVRNPIDAFVLRKLEENSLAPAPEAGKRTLARRVYFDLLGLPPSPAEISAFLADSSPQAYANLIDKLLADPRYGERWGRHWLDLVRYGETSGLEGDGAIGNAWRYRDWVVDAFNDDMPYDRFVTLQLAGADEHSKTRNNYRPDIQGHVPLGFLRVAPWDRSNLVADDVRQNYLSEVTSTTASVFLGLTLGCARCHDHKYDPIPQRDYYRFQAFFNAIQVENVDVPYADPEFATKASAKIKEIQERLREGPEKKDLDRLEAALLEKLIRYRKDHAAGRELTREDLRLELRSAGQRIFTASEKSRHKALKEDADRTQDPEEKRALDDYESALQRKLTEGYAGPGIDRLARFDTLKADDVRAEANNEKSEAFTQAERARHRELSEQIDILRRRMGRWQPVALTVKNVPGPPIGPALPLTHVLTRGDYRQPAEAVEAGFPSAIAGNGNPATIESDRYRQFPTRGWRITLARWIAGPENPLTARVMVNRIWQHHFGSGIVATPSDFGVNGERPTHPELLDWLAHRFIEEGWSVKAMHRLMLTSAAYRQSAENPAMNGNSRDSENRLLWRFNRRRLEAEAIRDSILSMSGRLNPERGGPSVFPALPEDLADFARYGRGGGAMWESNEKDEDGRRRSLYTFQRRSMPLPIMAAFDAPVFSESCERRSNTTTPLQALSMINGNLVQEEAAYLAKRAGDIAGAYELVLSRPPSAEEKAALKAFPGSLEGICRVLLNANEFLYVE